VDVIGHQYIGMDVTVISISGLLQPPKVSLIVTVFKKHWLTTVAPLDDVDWYIRY
jgi:hypothetical protein